ncbi:MAG: hypothetical protein HC806_02855 [Anaerolineae bacterium]|nr:hypothetical protein [Anaerolineae bacterium]
MLNAFGPTLIPIGWGAYQIEEWIPGAQIRLSKNPHYFRAAEGLPNFDHLLYQFVSDDPARNIPKLISGECDILEESAKLFDQGELLLAMAERNQLQAIFTSKPVWEHLDFGIVPLSFDNDWSPADDRPDLFGDVRTRRAIAYCVDRENVVKNVMFGQSAVLDSYLPPDHPLFNPDVEQYNFDPEEGIALLEEVGWVDADGDPATPRTFAGENSRIPAGTPLTFNYWTSTTPHRQQAAQLLAQSMSECGIQANVQFWSTGEYFIEGPDGPIFGRRFDLGELGWLIDVEPLCEIYLTEWIPGNPLETNPYLGEPFLSWQAPNISGFSNFEFDTACRTALASLPGQTSYTQNHLKAQEIFAAELPAIPLYLQIKVAAARADMCHFVLDPTSTGDFFNIELFDYGKKCDE